MFFHLLACSLMCSEMFKIHPIAFTLLLVTNDVNLVLLRVVNCCVNPFCYKRAHVKYYLLPVCISKIKIKKKLISLVLSCNFHNVFCISQFYIITFIYIKDTFSIISTLWISFNFNRNGNSSE